MSSPTQGLHDGGKFVFRSGVVCTDPNSLRVIVHYDSVADQYSFPQSTCEWLQTPKKGSVLESFDAAAERIAKTQFVHEATVIGSDPGNSRQTYGITSARLLDMKSPFLLETRATEAGIFEVTAWFLAKFDGFEETCEYPVTISARGKNFELGFFNQDAVSAYLSPRDYHILGKALDARK